MSVIIMLSALLVQAVTVQQTAPAPGSVLSNTIALSATAESSTSQITHIQFFVDGVLFATARTLQPPKLQIEPEQTFVAFAAQPALHEMRASIAPYAIPRGGSNAVIVIWKSISLGIPWTPFKPTAIFPATRTNTIFQALPGTYRFYATARVDPYGESDPSNITTNIVR